MLKVFKFEFENYKSHKTSFENCAKNLHKYTRKVKNLIACSCYHLLYLFIRIHWKAFFQSSSLRNLATLILFNWWQMPLVFSKQMNKHIPQSWWLPAFFSLDNQSIIVAKIFDIWTLSLLITNKNVHCTLVIVRNYLCFTS